MCVCMCVCRCVFVHVYMCLCVHACVCLATEEDYLLKESQSKVSAFSSLTSCLWGKLLACSVTVS